MAGIPKYAPVNAPISDKRSLVTPIWRTYFTSVEPPLGGGITELTGDGSALGPGVVDLTLADTGVVPGAYTNTNLTVDSKGRITAAADGSLGPGVLTLLTADPVSPVNDSFWLLRDGGSPEVVSLRVRVAGVTTVIPLGTLP